MHVREAKGWKGWFNFCTQTVRNITVTGACDAVLD